MAIKLPPVLKGMGEEAWAALGEKKQLAITKSLGDFVQNKLGKVDQFNTVKTQTFDNSDLGTISDAATMREQDIKTLDAQMRAILATGAAFAPDSDFNKGLAFAIKQQNKMFAQPKEGAEAYASLALNLNQFNKMTGKAFDKTGSFTGRLADQAATLKKLGLSVNEFTSNIDTAIYDLGMGQKGVEGFNLTIKQLSEDLDMLPGQVSRNFRAIAKDLMYESSMIKEEYAKLEILAQKTGLSATEIASQFGGSMDTISGASSAAANLNAMLGRNAFSATQLLGMTESERAEAVREAIQADSNIMADIQAGGVQGKFALKSVAEAMGMSGADARRFIQTGDADSVRAKIEKGMDSDAKTGKLDSKILIENFKNPAKQLGSIMQKMTAQFEKVMGPERAAQLGVRRKMAERIDAGDAPFLERFARMKSIGLLDGATEDQSRAIRRDPRSGALFNEIQMRRQMRLVSEDQTVEISKLLSSGVESERREGRIMARNIRDSSSIGEMLAQEIEGANLSAQKTAIAMSVVQALSGMTSYGGRVMLGKVIESLRKEEPLQGEDPKAAIAHYRTKAKAIDDATKNVESASGFISALEGTEAANTSAFRRAQGNISREQAETAAQRQSIIDAEESSSMTLERIRRSNTRPTKSDQARSRETGTTLNVTVGNDMLTVREVMGRIEYNGRRIDEIARTTE